MVVKTSARLAILLLLSHAIAAASIHAAVMSQPARLIVTVLLLLSLCYFLARDVLLILPASWREISLVPGGLSVALQNGAQLIGQISGETVVVGPHFIVLGVNVEGRHLPVFRVVFPDAVGQDKFRELCVCLKFA